ncbi:MAG: hypothetical protein ABJ275_11575 [Maricaulaceae bacterium]
MKKFIAIIVLIGLALSGAYFWLMSQSGAEHANQTIVTTPVSLDIGD